MKKKPSSKPKTKPAPKPKYAGRMFRGDILPPGIHQVKVTHVKDRGKTIQIHFEKQESGLTAERLSQLLKAESELQGLQTRLTERAQQVVDLSQEVVQVQTENEKLRTQLADESEQHRKAVDQIVELKKELTGAELVEAENKRLREQVRNLENYPSRVPYQRTDAYSRVKV